MPRPLPSMDDHMKSITKTERISPAGVRKYNRSLSMAVREAVDPMWIVEYNLLILQNKDPVLVVDGRSADGYRVTEGSGPSPSLDDRVKALRFLTERGWGQAVQQIQLDAELRGQLATLNAEIDLGHVGTLSYQQLQALQEVLGTRLPPAPQRTLDVVSEDVPSPEDASQDASDED